MGPRDEPDPLRLAAAREALRAALRGELRRRGLWASPPAWLGIYGFESWEGALEELVAEAYAFIFVDRLRPLRAQLEVKPNIDGLVFLNLRHFLHERQKEHDPLGSQVFEVLQSAVRSAVAAGDLYVLTGDPRVRNETILGFHPGAEPVSPEHADLPFLVARWNDDLLPDLVTLRGRRQEEVVQRVRERLSDLRGEGFEAFRFKDLIDPLKADVRARWGALLDHEAGDAALEGEDGDILRVRLTRPDTGYEDRQLFRKLVACVLDAIGRLNVNDKTKGYLTTLWQFLRIDAIAGPDEGRLSQRRIGEHLRIPRERLPELYDTLRRLVEPCRAANSGKLSVTSLQGGYASPGPRGISS
ncbi:MAG TPA: hypothetical protein VG477_12080 [Thermoanaerobaculia bacterium]|nr:hypothetical protein [Thermoanaerobaculia bacterium]